MNKTKTIYFLSAIVLIIGCYALNLSYSLFVQTEEKEIVNASVPSLIYNLEQNTFVIPANQKKAITLKINNIGNSNINYGILLDNSNLNDNILIQLVDEEDNDIVGNVLSNSSKIVKLFVTNNDTKDQTLNFKINATYETLNFDTENYITNTKIDRENKYKLTLSNQFLYFDERITKNDLTPVFDGVATEEEGLYKTIDDYGETWYFRGAQNYNYISFAGFTWRVVRLNGDDTIRVILNNVLENETIFNENNDYGIGYMYNNKNSTIKEVLDKFYETYLSNNEEYLADNLYCGEKFDEDLANIELTCAKGDIDNDVRYTSKLDESTTTIKGISINNNLTYPIGLLTAKELIMAGAWANETNTSYYLYDPTILKKENSIWWTMTVKDENNLVVSNPNTNSFDIETFNNYGLVRPVINLNSNVLVKSGNGTLESPYEVILPS